MEAINELNTKVDLMNRKLGRLDTIKEVLQITVKYNSLLPQVFKDEIIAITDRIQRGAS